MPDEQQQKRMEFKEPVEGITHVYANNVAMGTTKFDVRILFGTVRDITSESVIIEHRVQVTMTWAEAKLLAEFLSANIKAFEDLNGPITLPNIPPKIEVPRTFGNP
jgi:hypothetical protein